MFFITFLISMLVFYLLFGPNGFKSNLVTIVMIIGSLLVLSLLMTLIIDLLISAYYFWKDILSYMVAL